MKNASGGTQASRRRSNSQSHVVVPPSFHNQNSFQGSTGAKPPKSKPQKRFQAEYYVTLTPLNETFATKHIHVPFFPETCKLGRPTGTRVKPQITNGYFDSRVLSRNHACMFIDPSNGKLMVQDMGSSNGTFVNSEKITTDPVPVCVGDTINLGFNIQVETSHKQISARIDNINVVSNNPKGAASEGLPRLTLNIINNFSEAEMAHYDFVQNLFAKTQEWAPDNEQEKETDESLRAFDQAMFADVVPSIDEAFSNSSNDLNPAGIFNNSNIISSPELVSTLDYLNVNVAKLKQQNKALKSIESFFKKYASRVEEINISYLRSKMKEYDDNISSELASDLEKSSKMAHEQDLKLSEQSRLISAYKKKISELTQTNEFLSQKVGAYEKLSFHENSDNEFSFINESSLSNPVEELNNPQPQKTDSPSPQPVPQNVGEEKRTTVPNTDITEAVGEKAESKELTPTSSAPKPFLDMLQNTILQYRNQGVFFGLFIAVAGYFYQNNK